MYNYSSSLFLLVIFIFLFFFLHCHHVFLLLLFCHNRSSHRPLLCPDVADCRVMQIEFTPSFGLYSSSTRRRTVFSASLLLFLRLIDVLVVSPIVPFSHPESLLTPEEDCLLLSGDESYLRYAYLPLLPLSLSLSGLTHIQP